MKHLTLPNGLEMILVSRPDHDISGVALAVRAGLLQDSYGGIAHMLEHALFLSSEKYSDGKS